MSMSFKPNQKPGNAICPGVIPVQNPKRVSYIAQINVAGTTHRIGTFRSLQQAEIAFKWAKQSLHSNPPIYNSPPEAA